MRLLGLGALSLLLAAPSIASPTDEPKQGATAVGATTARLSEEKAIDLANARALLLKVPLSAYDKPKATYKVTNGRGIWHVFYFNKSHALDACFNIDVDDNSGTTTYGSCS